MKKILFCILMLAVFTFCLNAQGVRLALVNMTRIEMEANDFAEIRRQFQEEFMTYQQRAEDMVAEIERLENQYEARKTLMEASARQTEEEKIENKKREFIQFRRDNEGEGGYFEARQDELLAPIATRLEAIIERIAKEGNYTMVVHAAGVIYAQEDPLQFDITPIILHEMNKRD